MRKPKSHDTYVYTNTYENQIQFESNAKIIRGYFFVKKKTSWKRTVHFLHAIEIPNITPSYSSVGGRRCFILFPSNISTIEQFPTRKKAKMTRDKIKSDYRGEIYSEFILVENQINEVKDKENINPRESILFLKFFLRTLCRNICLRKIRCVFLRYSSIYPTESSIFPSFLADTKFVRVLLRV